MNRYWGYAIRGGDNRNVRVTIAAVLGALAWGLFLAVLGRGLSSKPVPERKPEPPLEMSAVEIQDPAPPVAPTRSIQVAPKAQTIAVPKQPPVKPTRAPLAQVRPASPAPQTPPAAAPPDPEANAKLATTPPAQTTNVAAPSEPSGRSTANPQQTSAAGSASGNSPARGIAQPLPSVPDDLREAAYQTVATAHLVIHTDGSVAVELIRPTQYPRLNQILIETLQSWRFFPAMQDGHPVETQQDVRVHFNVS